MKEVIRYLSKDNFLFENKNKCIAHEKFYDELESIVSPLPKSELLRNGNGYIQHDRAQVDFAMSRFLKAVPCIQDRVTQEMLCNPFKYRHSILGRILDDSNTIATKYWYRFMNMDDNYREYDQQYYALHPEQAEQTCLNAGPSMATNQVKKGI